MVGTGAGDRTADRARTGIRAGAAATAVGSSYWGALRNGVGALRFRGREATVARPGLPELEGRADPAAREEAALRFAVAASGAKTARREHLDI